MTKRKYEWINNGNKTDTAVRNCMWVRIKENHCRRDVISSDPVMVFCIR
ncbi:hypothetical protein COPCOM_01422 [Coprococcus comes ATCC 27758]|uniref:Uncharacterized protein n=1 Tax=Coprococcus comes ATCC 27758 TaxID=470146 RepID=C0B8E8_9FIRM|nr:hypothetical protein COPCOM_01422 [Coprococcus comes ATCC 27758]